MIDAVTWLDLKTGDRIRSASGREGFVIRPEGLEHLLFTQVLSVESMDDIEVLYNHMVRPENVTCLKQLGIGAIIRLKDKTRGCTVIYNDGNVIIAVANPTTMASPREWELIE